MGVPAVGCYPASPCTKKVIVVCGVSCLPPRHTWQLTPRLGLLYIAAERVPRHRPQLGPCDKRCLCCGAHRIDNTASNVGIGVEENPTNVPSMEVPSSVSDRPSSDAIITHAYHRRRGRRSSRAIAATRGEPWLCGEPRLPVCIRVSSPPSRVRA
jgi:hypothetical protein